MFFPTIQERYYGARWPKGAGHSLLDPKKSYFEWIFKIANEQVFLLLQEPIWREKSKPFCETVFSYQSVMAKKCGSCPVLLLKRWTIVLIKLITSMRTTDFATDDESYFFSELKTTYGFIVDE